MELPNWPADVPHIPLRDSMEVTPFGPGPIVTPMEGGNVRVRRRPGDEVKLVAQTVRMTRAQYALFEAWYTETTKGGAARFKVDVWDGSAMANKVCQFNMQQGGPKWRAVAGSDELCDVPMFLRVYNL